MSEHSASERTPRADPPRPDETWVQLGVSRPLFEQSPFSTVIYDAQGHLLAANPAFRTLWGVGIETAPPDYSVLTDPQLEEQGILPFIRRAFDGEAVRTPPVRYDIAAISETRSGRTIWTESHLFPVRAADGCIECVVLTHIDISARVSVEEALRTSEERFRGAQEVSPDAFVVFRPLRDESGRIVDFSWDYANPAATAVEGVPLAELYGQSMLARNPGAVASGLFAGYAHTAETGEPFSTELRDQDERFATSFRITCVKLDDGIAVTFSDVSAAFRAQERARALLSVAAALSEAVTPEQVAEVMFREGLGTLRADGGSLGVVLAPEASGLTEIEMVRTRGYGAEAVERYHRITVTPGRPLSDAVISGQPVLLDSKAHWEAQYPGQFANIEELGFEAYAALPVVVGGRTVAGVSFSFRGTREFDEETRTFLETVGRLCAQALERARSYEAEQRERLRSQFLAEASALLSGSMHFEQTLRNLALAAVPRLGDWCAIELVIDPAAGQWPPRMERIALVHQDADMMAPGAALTSESPLDWSATEGLAAVLRDAKPVFWPIITPDILSLAARDARHLQLLSTLHLASVMIVPMVARGVTVGALTLCTSESGRRFDEGDLHVAEDLASRAAISVDNARLYREANDARREAETFADRLARVFHQAPVAIAVLRGPEHVFETANPLYERIVGRTGIVGLPLRAALPELEGQGVFELLDGVRATGEPYIGTETRILLERGPDQSPEEAWFNFVFQPLVDISRRVVGIAVVAVEVTTQMRARSDAERLQHEAEDANRAKSEFLATMSHELRTPLNAIGGYTELLDMGLRGPVTAAQHEDLQRIRKSQQHLLGLINAVLNFARLAAGHTTYETAMVPLHGLLTHAVSLMEPQANTRNVTLVPVHCAEAVAALGDAEKIRQIVFNLLSNAIKFTPAGGQVALSCHLLAGPEPQRACIEVTDTGIGIAKEHLESVFDPFVQVGRSLTSSHEGAGLGLAISRDLARGMAGDLLAQSDEGTGTTFTLLLPTA